jgi:aerobic C4-dicarboxylate transport protein
MTPAETAPPPRPKRKRFYNDLSLQVLAAMVLGVGLGVWKPDIATEMKPFGDAFIRLIQMVVGPIIFCTVVNGIAGMGDLKKVGRIAIKAIIYFEVVTSIALVLGLVIVNLLQPGAGMHVDPATLAAAGSRAQGYATEASHLESTSAFLLDIIPNAAIAAFAKGDVLQILFFSVLFACGLAAAGDAGKPVLDVVRGAAKALFWIINLVMKFAPIAAFGAIAFTVARFGVASLTSLAALIGAFYLTCLIFVVRCCCRSASGRASASGS